MIPRLLLAALLLVAGCARAPQQQQPATGEQSALDNATAAPAGRQVSHEDLFGQWRLVGMPGVAAGQPLNIHMLIGRYGIEAVSQCITFGKMLPGAVLPEVPRSSPAPLAPLVCARTRTPLEQRFGPALASVQTMERLSDGRVALKGGKGTLVVERQVEPVLNPLQNRPGPGPLLMWGEWRVAAVNGSEPSSPMRLLFFRDRLELGSGCVHYGRRMEQEGPKLRLSPDPNVTTICERMTSPAEDAAEQILSGTVTIAQSTPRRRLLRSSAGTLTLER